MLPADYLADAERRARRYCSQWTGTNGSLAADVIRLLKERKQLMSTLSELEEANAALRAGVESRYVVAAEASCCEGGPMCTPAQQTPTGSTSLPADWILRGDRELRAQKAKPAPVRFMGDGLLQSQAASPAEQLLETAQRTVAARRKTYGPPTEHFRKTVGMINAAFSDVLRRPLTESDWAVIMTLDKIARHQGPNKTDDTPIDLAGYAACLAECEQATRPADG